MQQTLQMIPMMTPFPPTNITTEQIQKYLDENKKLIMAILDNQNLGKLAECARYQAQLQKNLMYLAAIADAQPQTPAMPPQMAPHPAMQPGHFTQYPQAAAMAQQHGISLSKVPLQFGNPRQMPDPKQQQPQPQSQALQGQMGMRPSGIINSMHPMHEAAVGSGGNKQEASALRSTGGNNPGGSAARVDGDSSYPNESEEAK